jgi:Leucine-rich repeat (LRR) protein
MKGSRKMRMRRFLCTLITVSLIFTIVFAQVSFSVTGDIRNAENAERLSKIGIFKGDSAGFGLERQLTRAEAAALIVRLIGKEKEVLNGNYSHPFSDVQSWADKYVGYLYTNKLTTGISSTLYGSSEYVSLQQFVTFILRVLGYSDQKGDFKYSQCLEKAVQIGLLNNEEVYYYTSKDSFIRDDIVGIIVNALSTNVKDSGTTLLEKLVYEGAIDMEAAAGAGFISLEPVTIKDPNLEAKIREIIGKKEGELFAYELEKIESIDARNSGISSLDGLQYCKNLKKLYITDNKITDLEPLSGLVHLTALLAARNEIKNIDTLSNLTDLQFLDLSVNKINIIKPLESLANLETLGIGNNPIVDITPVSSLRNLEQLSLNGLNLSDLKLVENLDKLTWIYAGANEIIDISHLAKLENLSYLDLTFNKVSDISVLKKLKNLKVLKVSNNSINDISSISELVNLEELDLSDNNISDIAALKGLVNLKSLFLSNNPIANYMPIKDIYGQLETKDFNVVFP